MVEMRNLAFAGFRSEAGDSQQPVQVHLFMSKMFYKRGDRHGAVVQQRATGETCCYWLVVGGLLY